MKIRTSTTAKQLEALDELAWLYDQAAMFYRPKRHEATGTAAEVKELGTLERELDKGYRRAGLRILAAKEKLLATGYDVPDSWLTVRATGMVSASGRLLDLCIYDKPAEERKRIVVVTDTGADLAALNTVRAQMYVAALKLRAGQGHEVATVATKAGQDGAEHPAAVAQEAPMPQRRVSPCHRLAHESYVWACNERPNLLHDDLPRFPVELYNHVKEHWNGYDGNKPCPSRLTWERYVREYERRLKNSARAGRTGHSIIRPDER